MMKSNSHLVSVAEDILIHNENDQDPIKTFNNHDAVINKIKFNLYGTVIASGSDDSTIKFTGVKDQKVLLIRFS